MSTLEAYGNRIIGSFGTVDDMISDKYDNTK